VGAIHSILFSNKIEVTCTSHFIQEKTDKVTSDIFHLPWIKCPWVKCPWGQMSLGSNVLGVKCPWCQMSLGSNVLGGQTSLVPIISRSNEKHKDLRISLELKKKVFLFKILFFSFFLTTILVNGVKFLINLMYIIGVEQYILQY